jgi:hypothetical protein
MRVVRTQPMKPLVMPFLTPLGKDSAFKGPYFVI